MKKLLLLSALAFAVSAGTGFAQSAGIFGYGIELTGTGAGAVNNGTEELYALKLKSDSRLLPSGSSASLSNAWGIETNVGGVISNSSTAAAPTFSLGTFTTTDSLVLDGASELTYKSGGADVTSAYLNYRVNLGSTGSGGFSPGISLPFNQDNVSGTTGDQRWSTESVGTNLLTGLAPGTYTLTTYGYASSTVGDQFASNNGNDFAATFTVVAVPEPGTWAMMLGGLGVLVLFQIRRRQFVG